MKRIIRLTESDLHRIVNKSVKRILKEDRYAWDLANDGIDEFSMESGYPTRETSGRYSSYDYNIGDKICKARAMGQDQASGRDWMQNVHDTTGFGNKFSTDNPRFRFARQYVNNGKYYPNGFPNNAEEDLNDFNKQELRKQAAADKRWMNAADNRPLHRKGSLNREI